MRDCDVGGRRQSLLAATISAAVTKAGSRSWTFLKIAWTSNLSHVIISAEEVPVFRGWVVACE
jgi:hypothetical protein